MPKNVFSIESFHKFANQTTKERLGYKYYLYGYVCELLGDFFPLLRNHIAHICKVSRL